MNREFTFDFVVGDLDLDTKVLIRTQVVVRINLPGKRFVVSFTVDTVSISLLLDLRPSTETSCWGSSFHVVRVSVLSALKSFPFIRGERSVPAGWTLGFIQYINKLR